MSAAFGARGLEGGTFWLGQLQELQRKQREWGTSQTHIPLIGVGTALLEDWRVGMRVMWGGYEVKEGGTDVECRSRVRTVGQGGCEAKGNPAPWWIWGPSAPTTAHL